MNNLCISQVNARPSFGAVKLGRGGAEVMADRLFIKNAKAFISGQSRFNTTVLVSKDAVEVIPVEQNLIFKVTGQFRRSPKKHYLDVAVEEHGEKAYIRIPRNVKNTELYEYGKENTQFTLARIIANEMESNIKITSGPAIIRK